MTEALQTTNSLPVKVEIGLIGRFDSVGNLSHEFSYRIGGDMDVLFSEFVLARLHPAQRSR
jgi:hypothetical protein